MRRALALSTLLALGCSRPVAPAPAPTPPASAPAVRYLALGDSFTAGTGASLEQSFPSRWADRLRAHGRAVELRNLAVNGYTTDDVLARELPQVRGFAPTVVTLAIGANDLVHGRDEAAYREHLRALLDAIAAQGIPFARVVALPQPAWALSTVGASFGEPAALLAHIEATNAILRELVQARGGRYLDLWALMQRQARAGQFAHDGLHPSAEAYDAWAEALYTGLALGPDGAPR